MIMSTHHNVHRYLDRSAVAVVEVLARWPLDFVPWSSLFACSGKRLLERVLAELHYEAATVLDIAVMTIAHSSVDKCGAPRG